MGSMCVCIVSSRCVRLSESVYMPRRSAGMSVDPRRGSVDCDAASLPLHGILFASTAPFCPRCWCLANERSLALALPLVPMSCFAAYQYDTATRVVKCCE